MFAVFSMRSARFPLVVLAGLSTAVEGAYAEDTSLFSEPGTAREIPIMVPWAAVPSEAYQSSNGEYVLYPALNFSVALISDQEESDVAVSTRAVARGRGAVGVIARGNAYSPVGYVGVLDTCGHLRLYVADGVRLVQLAAVSVGFAADSEFMIRIDAVDDRLELRAWRHGDTAPSDPQITAVDDSIERGQSGVVFLPESFGEAPSAVFHEASSDVQRGGSTIFRRGDVDADGTSGIGDALFTLNYLFRGRTEPTCVKSMDIDDSGKVEISDSIALLGFLFLGGPEPAEPFVHCGEDPTEDRLGCSASACE